MTISNAIRAIPNPTYRVPSLHILASELEEFKRTGRQLHLLHAVRALDDARVELRNFVHLQLRPHTPGEADLINEREQ